MVQRIFLIFGVIEMVLYHSTQTTCPGKVWFSSYGLKSSRPIRSLNYFFRLWQRMALRNFLNFYMMIVKMILYHHVEIACPGKVWFSSYGPKSSRPIRLLDYFFRLWQRTTVMNFLNFYMMIVEMILYHHVQIACPGKFWFLNYGPKSSRPVTLLNYFFRLWQRTTVRSFLNFYIISIHFLLFFWFSGYFPSSCCYCQINQNTGWWD